MQRRVKKKLNGECVEISSDEEGGSNMTPGKRLKLEDDHSKDSGSDSDRTEVCFPARQSDELGNGTAKESVNKLTPSTAITVEILKNSAAQYRKDLEIDKERINRCMEEGNFISIPCRSFRVGTYKAVCKSESENFDLVICEYGVKFLMHHVKEQRKKMHIYIPKSSTMRTTAYAGNKRNSFIMFAVTNKLAASIRETLGMIEKTDKGWFDTMGAFYEKYIVCMVQTFRPEAQATVANLYNKDYSFLNSDDAQSLLVKLASPHLLPEYAKNNRPVLGDKVGKMTENTSARKLELNKSKISTNENTVCNKPVGYKSNTSELKATPSTKAVVTNGNSTPTRAKHVYESIFDDDKQILNWPKDRPGITLHQSDILTLRPEQFLNDQILDFWHLYIHNNLLNEVDRERTYIFSTFFYNRLTTKPKLKTCPAWEKDKTIPSAEKRHRRVKKWTKNVDLFSKDFIIVPINESCHWYVAVICYPGMLMAHWMDDDTPIEGWSNIVKIKGRLKYVPPPGKPHREERERRRRRREPSSDSNNEVSHTQDNDEMDGNSLIQNDLPCPSSSEKALSTSTSPQHRSEESSTMGNTTEDGTPASNKLGQGSSSPEYLVPDIDPYKDEAEEDSDEDKLAAEDYDSDDSLSSTTNQSSQQDTAESDIPESSDVKIKVEVEVKTEPEDIKPKIEDGAVVRTNWRVKQPCILIFDSLPCGAKTRVATTLREYLRVEAKERKGEDKAFTTITLPSFPLRVPKQGNMCDCGIYVLQYIEQFFSTPLPDLCLPITGLKKWFPELTTKRKEVYDTIYELTKAQNPEKLPLIPQFKIIRPPSPKPTRFDLSTCNGDIDNKESSPSNSQSDDKGSQESATDSKPASKNESVAKKANDTPVRTSVISDGRSKTPVSVAKTDSSTKILLTSKSLRNHDAMFRNFSTPITSYRIPRKSAGTSIPIQINSTTETVTESVSKHSEENSPGKAILSTSNTRPMKITATQVEAAPRQKITLVMPAEEPMDIDP